MPTYTDTGLTNGTTYYYTVTGINGVGEGPNSSQVAVTPQPVTANGWYDFGVKPTGWTFTQLYSLDASKWASYKSYTFTQTGMPSGMPSGAWRVQVPDQYTDGNGGNNHTFSEGIGYGTLQAAYRSDPSSPIYDPNAASYFQGFVKYYNFFRDDNGFMHWRTDRFGNITGTGGATDGDMDFMWGLYVWNQMHEGGSKTTAIGAQLVSMINALDATCFFPASHPTWPNIMKNGDKWDPNLDNFMDDYCRPAYWKAWGTWIGNSTRWNAITTANQAHVQYMTSNYPTGYVPDASTRVSHTAVSGYAFAYGYNSIRYPWGQGLHYLNNGDAISFAALKKMATAEKTRAAGVVANARAERTMDGTSAATYINKAYVSGFAISGTMDSTNIQWSNDCLTWLSNATEASYFGQGMEVLATLLMTGEARTSFSSTDPTPGVISGAASFRARTRVTGTARLVYNATAPLRIRTRLSATGSRVQNGTASFRARTRLTGTPGTPQKQGSADIKLRTRLQAAPVLIASASGNFRFRTRLRGSAAVVTTTVQAIKLNFQPASSTTPAGWVAEIGNPFEVSRGYGWEIATSSATATLRIRTRLTATGTQIGGSTGTGWGTQPWGTEPWGGQ